MSNLFLSVYRFFQHRKSFLWILLAIITFVCVWGLRGLESKEDISGFLPQNEENERINFAYQHMGAANEIMLTVKMKDTAAVVDKEALIETVDVLAEHLSQIDTCHVKSIKYMVDQEQIMQITNFITANLPYFLTEADYARMDSLISQDIIRKKLENTKSFLSSPMGGMLKQTFINDPLGFSLPVLSGLQSFQLSNAYQLYDDYIFNKEGTEAVVILTSNHPVSETANNALLIENIDKAIHKTIQSVGPSITIDSFGAAYVSVTNAQQIKRDSWLSIAIALILIFGLLIYFFRNIRSLVLIFASILFGGLFSLGILSLFSDSISLIAIGIGSVIMGIAANYPLHFLAHYRHGYSIEESLNDITPPLTTGNITTIGAFLSLLFISSESMHDFGWFASLLLLGTILFVLIFLPHFLPNRTQSMVKDEKLVFKKLAAFSPENNKWIVGLICVLSFVFFFLSKHTTFETDMHKINYMTDNQAQQMEKLNRALNQQKHMMYCVSEGKSLEEALENYEKTSLAIDSLMQKDTFILKKSCIGIYLPSPAMQAKRIALWNSFWKYRKDSVLQNLTTESESLGFKQNAFAGFESILQNEYQIQPTRYFSPVIDAFAGNFIINEADRAMIFTVLLTEPEHRTILENKLNAINDQTFGFDSASITFRMVNALSDDFDYVLYICGFLVLFFLTLSFGRFEISLLTFIPLLIAWIWILGLMHVFDMRFNIINIILATFIFGMGDDYAIFVTEGLMYEYTYRKRMLTSYKNTVLLSAFIMFIGIGSLILAKHPAMRSLAEVTIVGMISVVLMAYVFPPLLFKWLTTHKGKNRPIPITFWNFFKTFISFTVFFLGSLWLSLTAICLMIIGRKNKKLKYRYHQFLCATMRFLSSIMIQVPYKISNQQKETFNKPGIIICNHQSHLDLLYTLMLSPKIIVLTNKWVWNSPFYGWIIRYADFLPVIDGIENNVEKLEKLVADGYSILVFPEGTRSADCSILRFHQGAFYLADTLKLDIIPIVTHGIGHMFPKKEFLLRKGEVHIKILDRIKPDNSTFRLQKTVLETTKLVRKLYKETYQQMSKEIETPDYYKDLVLYNYIYKGRSVEQSARKLLKATRNFSEQIAQLPDEGSYHIAACGQGEFALMAALVKKNLQITATDPDPEKLALARSCTSVPKNLKYIE
ncbi:MAG: 1-acyl-sn-glycerol-3-phosphate acyltransferase [Bacteroidales bacterium]|nr:1-acyl-sn-glycerol-3-phosphate acyltransferase [Bacteroidales bacterium]